MKNLILEQDKIELTSKDKNKDFLKLTKQEDGVLVKIKNHIYKVKMGENNKLWTKAMFPIFEFDSEDELENVIKTLI